MAETSDSFWRDIVVRGSDLKPQEFEGYWNLAGRDDSVPGKLTFSPEHGAVLALNGAFEGHDPFTIDNTQYTIHGVTPTSSQITLPRCRMRRRSEEHTS